MSAHEMTAAQVRESIDWESPKPPVTGRCKRCPWGALCAGAQVVSPTGLEHLADYGVTMCGRDATGDGWWWPL